MRHHLTALAVLFATAACTPRYDLTPPLEAGVEGRATWWVNREARVILGDDRMRTRVEGEMSIQVGGGAVGSEAVVFHSTPTTMTMERTAQGATVHLTSADELPETLQPDFAPEGVARQLTVPADRQLSDDDGRDDPHWADLEAFMDPVLHAPADKVAVGAHWSRPLRTDDDGTEWFRRYELTEVKDGRALISFRDVYGGPESTESGPTENQTRGEQWVDLATGLPYNLRIRDLHRGVIGVDTRATFHWPGADVMEF